MATFDEWMEELEDNPPMFFWRPIKWILILSVIIGTFGYFMGWFSDAGNVAKKEFSASAMLKKYEWFKDASSQLDKKIADMDVWNSKIKSIESQYAGKGRTDWVRQDIEQHNIWITELSGIKASYNSLAAEYNAAMSKFNYAFCNAGDLPEGADKPLPREYKPYVSQ